jgi:hypothetical protein
MQEKTAYEIFENWAKNNGFKIKDMRYAGIGYDYKIIDNEGKLITFEIKGSKRINSIPDMSVAEFDQNKRLKADFLFVINNIHEKGKEIIFKIPRNSIKPENLLLKQTYRIERFQNKKIMKQFRIK